MNKALPVYVAGFLLLGVGLSALAGCDIHDVIHARTPNSIQKTEGLPARLSVNESRAEYLKWLQSVQTDAATWRGSIENAEAVAGLLSNLTLSALDEAGPAILGLPMGGALLPVVAGLAGLFLKRPGDKTAAQVAAEKEASFNSGLKRGAAAAAAKIEV
jgi:hypothetical protein